MKMKMMVIMIEREGGTNLGIQSSIFRVAILYENFVGEVPRHADSGPPPFSGALVLPCYAGAPGVSPKNF
eukprot:5819100-Amphidinium_carterae.1